jgi:hypothetical protein
LKQRIPDVKERREAERARAKRAALKALKRARKASEEARVALSDWEGEFLGSVEGRVERYGRAFRDPEKGGTTSALSILQAQKLREIAVKAKGGKKPWGRSRPLGAKPRSGA